MTERPILFSAPMVRAVLAGAKTQTRRVVKPQPPEDHEPPHRLASGQWVTCENRPPDILKNWPLRCPYGQPGDLLWVVTILPVAGHEGRYGAGDDGHVYRVDSPEPRRLRESQSAGYRRVTLGLGAKRRQENRLVHELVCSAFYGPRPTERHVVRHLDGDRSNNLPGNLDWGTPEDNWADRKAHEKGVHEEHHNAKLTMAKAEEMRASGESAWALAKRFGVSPKTVRNVLRGKTWVRTEAPPPNMPRWASRLTLRVTNVRVERVQDISEEDALADGGWTYGWCPIHKAPERSFAELWDGINGKREGCSWEANPWVWVVGFERVEAGQ